MSELWKIDVGYFCAGLLSEDGIVIKAAPILKWTLGKNIEDVQKWVKSKRGLMILVPLVKVQGNGDNKASRSKAAEQSDRPQNSDK
jgi:hypothetical protein